MQQHIAGCSDGWARARPKLAKGMQFRRARRTKQPIPCVRAEAHHAQEAALYITKFHRTNDRGKIGAERANVIERLSPRVYFQDEKDCCACQRSSHRLRYRTN